MFLNVYVRKFKNQSYLPGLPLVSNVSHKQHRHTNITIMSENIAQCPGTLKDTVVIFPLAVWWSNTPQAINASELIQPPHYPSLTQAARLNDTHKNVKITDNRTELEELLLLLLLLLLDSSAEHS